MRTRAVVLTLIVSTIAVLSAHAQTTNELRVATFCDGTYALCIKAPCNPIVSRKPDGTYSVDEANCVCDVVTGWSMGPGACDKRAPATVGGRTYIESTYSNLFNKTNRTLSCSNENTTWALCYGAPCAVDEHDSSKAICTCPVKTSAMETLGGGCKQSACKSLWSAATPAIDAFANDYFYKYMTEHKLRPPANPPAENCPAPKAQ